MVDALIHLSIFIIQVIVIIGAILVVFGGIMAIASKNKDKSTPKLSIKKLNQKYEEMKLSLEEAILSKKDKKKAAKAAKKSKKHPADDNTRPNLYVLDFEGDIKASDVENLRQAITAVLTVATPKDEIVVRLESAGGAMHAYGLASSQLARVRDKHIPLTICIDKIAASGGYMMACVANKVVAAPFAIVGSIGVIAQLPNFHRVLKDKHIDYEQITAGQFKRTLTVFGENTSEGRQKFQAEIDEAHDLFKGFIADYRPQTDLEKVATGEHWFARKAFELNLVDTLLTSDDYLLRASNNHNLYEIKYKKKKPFMNKLGNCVQLLVNKFFFSLNQVEQDNHYLK